jgi:hypothetical protein
MARLADRETDRRLSRLDPGKQLIEPHEWRAAGVLRRTFAHGAIAPLHGNYPLRS